MKNVPKQAPSVTARTLYQTLKPIDGPTNPVTMVTTTKLPVNQNGP